MKILVAILSIIILLLAGGFIWYYLSVNATESPVEIEDVPVESLEVIDEVTCKQQGDVWTQRQCGPFECSYSCQEKYADGGTSCTSSDQCEGRCLVVNPREMYGIGIKEPAGCTLQGTAPYLSTYECSKQYRATCEEHAPVRCQGFYEVNGTTLDIHHDPCPIG